VLNADQPVGNYWIRANASFPGTPGFDGGRNSAILRYAGAPDADPTSTQQASVNPLNEINLHALTHPAAPGLPFVGGADVVLTINLNLEIGSGSFAFTLNGVAYKPPTAPVLLQILSGAQSAQDLLPPGSIYTLPPNKVIEINIPGLSAGGPVSFRRCLVLN